MTRRNPLAPLAAFLFLPPFGVVSPSFATDDPPAASPATAPAPTRDPE